MGIISLLIRQFIYTSLILLPCLRCVNSRDSPSPPSPSPDFNSAFEDLKLDVVHPIIQRFKNTITADPFKITKTWAGPDICNKYKGFFCDTLPDNSSAKALVALDFNGLQLAAPTLGGFIDQLPDLAIFHANTNNFSGTISPKILSLPYFYELDISNNRIFGVFPQALLGNSLTGCLPWEIGLLKNATVYSLTGCLPWEIGLLKNATVFDVSFNQLIGPIPQSFQCLFNIGLLNLARNQFYGEVPEAVCKVPNLYNFSLSYNYLTQVGPICRK